MTPIVRAAAVAIAGEEVWDATDKVQQSKVLMHLTPHIWAAIPEVLKQVEAVRLKQSESLLAEFTVPDTLEGLS